MFECSRPSDESSLTALMVMELLGLSYKSGLKAPSGLVGMSPLDERVGPSSGDSGCIRMGGGFGEMRLPMRPGLDGSVGNELRVSTDSARAEFRLRENWKIGASPVDVLRPSGPNVRICGDEP